MQHQQLWLGAVLARTQPCDGAGPAVELPGLRHVIDAHKEGQAACDGPVRPGIARSRLWEAVADAARCSAPVAAAV